MGVRQALAITTSVMGASYGAVGGTAARVLDAMPFAVIGLTRRDTVAFVNPAAETLLQRSAPLLRGRPLTDLLPEDAPLLDFINRARREGGVMSARAIRIASPHIAPVDLDVSASPDGEDGGLVLTFLPIHFLHPVRVQRLRPLNMAVFFLWCGFGGYALLLHFQSPAWVVWGTILSGLYLYVIGGVLQFFPALGRRR